MFIGIRDIKYAKGRFALIVSVIAMMTFMVVALSALTNGLQSQSISAITRLPGQTLVLQSGVDGQAPTLSESTLDDNAVAALRQQHPGNVAELGVTTTRLMHDGKATAAAVFGADPRLMPGASDGARPNSGGLMLDSTTAGDLGVAVGDTVTAGGMTLRVDGVGVTGSYAHTPVVYTPVDTWNELSHSDGINAVVLMSGSSTVAGTTAMPMDKATSAVPGYGSEHGSLLAMQGLLLAISALVVGAFFAVWTIQRLRDLAVVRAMGADRWYLLRDGLGQALLVLVLGEALGAALGIGLALAAAGVVPIALTAGGIALPIVAMTVLGALGALLAVRKVTVVDPLVAMSA